MIASRSRRAARLVLAAVLGGALLGAVAPSGTAATPTAGGGVRGEVTSTVAAATKNTVTATLVKLTPGITRPGDDVTVVVEVHNGTKKALAHPRVSLSLNRYRASTRADVDAWAEADPSADVGTQLAAEDADGPLAPGATWTATVTAEAASFGLSPVWGPRLLAVSVSDGTGARLAVVRTFLLWYPVGASGPSGSAETVTPVRLSVAVPLTGPTVTPADPDRSTAALEAATAGRLAHVVDATKDVPAVTWAADPALVATASTSGGTAAAWARVVCGAAKEHDTYALPAFDTDATALAHAGHQIPQGAATATTARCDAASDTGTDLRTAWHHGLTWPASGSPDRDTFATAVRSDRPLVLARGTDDGPLSPVTATSTTPDAATTVHTDAGNATALVADGQLSDLLARTGATAAAQQLLLAHTAVVARQSDDGGAGTARLLVTLPRGWDPDPATARAELEALDDAPWVTLEPLGTLTKPAPDDAPDVVRRAPAASSPSAKELDPESVDALLSARSSVRRFSTVVDDPDAVAGPVEADTLAPIAVAFRSDAHARSDAVQAGLDAARAVTAGVSVVGGSTLNIISAKGDLPVTVRNELDQPVTVRVALRSTDPKLGVLEEPELTVPARDTATVGVPVRAIGNGNVSAYVQLLTPAGSTITTAPAFDVRVRADWETVATTVIVVLLGVALVAGIWRTVRRGRSTARVTRAEAPEAEVAGTPEVTGQVPLATTAGAPPPPTPHDARPDTEDQPSDPATPAGRGPA